MDPTLHPQHDVLLPPTTTFPPPFELKRDTFKTLASLEFLFSISLSARPLNAEAINSFGMLSWTYFLVSYVRKERDFAHCHKPLFHPHPQTPTPITVPPSAAVRNLASFTESHYYFFHAPLSPPPRKQLIRTPPLPELFPLSPHKPSYFSVSAFNMSNSPDVHLNFSYSYPLLVPLDLPPPDSSWKMPSTFLSSERYYKRRMGRGSRPVFPTPSSHCL